MIQQCICSFLLIIISILLVKYFMLKGSKIQLNEIFWNKQVAKLLISWKVFTKYNFWFSLRFEKFWSYFHKFLCILIWNILILLSSYVKVVMILLELCLSIVHISKTIVNFFERFHFGIILPVILWNILSLSSSHN